MHSTVTETRSKLGQRALGWVFMITGVVVMALILWVLFAPPPELYLPTLIIGVGSLVAVLYLVIGLSRPN